MTARRALGISARAGSSLTVTPDQAAAFRLDRQHLAQRLPASSIIDAFEGGPLQDTPPGTAELSLLARVDGLEPGLLERLLGEEKSLLYSYSLRGAPYIYPTAQRACYTLGLLPDSETDLAAFIQGIKPALAAAGMTAGEVVQWTVEAVRHVLDGQIIEGKQNLDRALAAWVAPRLSDPRQSAAWNSPSLYAEDQTLGEAMVSFALRPAALLGWIGFAGRSAAFARIDQWLGAEVPAERPDPSSVEQASMCLLRRYLGSLGPSTPQHFALWAGITNTKARSIWDLLAGELLETRLEGQPAWMLQADLPRLESPRPAQGARLLPALDPYLQLRDRANLIPQPALQRSLWRNVGGPGLALLDGLPAALWRARKLPGKASTSRLRVTFEPVADLSGPQRILLEEESQRLAPFKGCAAADPLWGSV